MNTFIPVLRYTDSNMYIVTYSEHPAYVDGEGGVCMPKYLVQPWLAPSGLLARFSYLTFTQFRVSPKNSWFIVCMIYIMLKLASVEQKKHSYYLYKHTILNVRHTKNVLHTLHLYLILTYL